MRSRTVDNIKYSWVRYRSIKYLIDSWVVDFNQNIDFFLTKIIKIWNGKQTIKKQKVTGI